MQESLCDGWKQWWEDDCKLWKVALWCLLERSTGTLFSAQYVKKMDLQTVQWCAW